MPGARWLFPMCSRWRLDRSRRARRRRRRRRWRRRAAPRSRGGRREVPTGAPENGNTITFSNAVLVGELAIERQQDVVDDEEAVLGVGGDPADLVGRQAQVERVHDAAGGRDAEVALEVGVVVPGQRRDAIALLQAELRAGRRRGGACAGGTRRSCACCRDLSGRRETTSFCANKVPARSSRWLSESGASIMVERMRASLGIRPRRRRGVRARRRARRIPGRASTSRPASRSRRPRARSRAGTLLHEALARIQRQRARVQRLHVEPEAVRVEVANAIWLCAQPHPTEGQPLGLHHDALELDAAMRVAATQEDHEAGALLTSRRPR